MPIAEPIVTTRDESLATARLKKDILKSFSSRGFFIPRGAPRPADGETLSLAVAARSKHAASSAAGSPLSDFLDKKSVPVAADVSDLESAESVYEPLVMLGATMAAFRDFDAAMRAAEEVEGDFEFVPDFALRLPDPITPPANRLSHSEIGSGAVLQEWPEESGIAEAHGGGNRGADVLVGILDTGIDAAHAEFADRAIPYRYVSFYPTDPRWPSRDVFGFDTGLHGTHVAGILRGANRGIAPDADLYVASVIESEATQTSLRRVLYGLDWILWQFSDKANRDKPGIVNLSLGFPSEIPADIDRATYEAQIRMIRYIVQDLAAANVLTVAAIGNSGEDTCGYPGAFGDVLGVGAVDYGGSIADFSGNRRDKHGPIEANKPDLVGYGVDVQSSTERDHTNESYYGELSGTSMAAPYVSGIAALYRADDPDAEVTEIRERILSNCVPLSGEPRHRTGAGLARYNRVGIV